MTICERIADWISGGALTSKCNLINRAFGDAAREMVIRQEYEATLRQITALETPKANATVRKMARIAREALA